MSQPVTTYVTHDGSAWLNVQHPDGLVPPPVIELHRPLSGPVTFYFASCHGLAIPPEAQEAAGKAAS